jgi:predicted nucleic acid-binding protein
MPGLPNRLYLDSSVFGGAFDPEFADDSLALIDLLRTGYYRLVISPLVDFEIATAPDAVAALYRELAVNADIAQLSVDASSLHEAYLAHRIVGPRSESDALHVAVASVAACLAIVSWNFKHIVHMEKIRQYNAVNRLLGYNFIAIHSPSEVLRYEEV